MEMYHLEIRVLSDIDNRMGWISRGYYLTQESAEDRATFYDPANCETKITKVTLIT